VVSLAVAEVIVRAVALHATLGGNLAGEVVIVRSGQVDQACARINNQVLSNTRFYIRFAEEQPGEIECPPLGISGN